MDIEITFPEEEFLPERRSSKEEQRPSMELEGEAAEKQALLKLISKDGLEAKQALRIVAHYGEAPSESGLGSFREQLGIFGLNEEDLTPIERKQCLAIIDSLSETGDLEDPETVHAQLESFLANNFLQKAFVKIDRFSELSKSTKEAEPLRAALRDAMQAVAAMVKITSPSDPNTANLWKDLSERYVAIAVQKKEAGAEQKKVFEEVFEEFRDVIEGDLYDNFAMSVYMQGEQHTFDPERLSMALYGRTEEEVRLKKAENRKSVVQYLEEHRDDEPSMKLLQDLHRIYNNGIVPRKYADMRKKGHEITFGGKRVGILGEDVEAEVLALIDRTKNMLEQKHVGVRYGIESAKLHNELLHIHPFSDRNGSTSMLYLEFLMAKRGYAPSEKKTSRYYDYVRKVVKNNPLAVAVVGGGQYEMVRAFGYYEGETTKGKEEQYRQLLEREYGVKKE